MDNENIEFKNLPIGVQYMSWINKIIILKEFLKNYSMWVFLDRQIN